MPVVRLERRNVAASEVVAHPDASLIAAARRPLVDGVADVAVARHASAHARERQAALGSAETASATWMNLEPVEFARDLFERGGRPIFIGV